ncbi:MAG: hypothetical protein P8X85_22900 [Desulfobacterales bacterium]
MKSLSAPSVTVVAGFPFVGLIVACAPPVCIQLIDWISTAEPSASLVALAVAVRLAPGTAIPSIWIDTSTCAWLAGTNPARATVRKITSPNQIFVRPVGLHPFNESFRNIFSSFLFWNLEFRCAI